MDVSFSISEIFPVRVGSYSLNFLKVFETTDLDSIILDLLLEFGDSSSLTELAYHLGFTTNVSNQEGGFYDPVETDILIGFLNTLDQFHLIEIRSIKEGNGTVQVTELGVRARESGSKCLFCSGFVSIPEFHLLEIDSKIIQSFPFAKFGLHSHIVKSIKIEPFQISDLTEKTVHTIVAMENLPDDEEKGNTVVDSVNSVSRGFGQSNVQLDLTLVDDGAGFGLEFSLNGVRSPEFDSIMRTPENAPQYERWILKVRYEYYCKTAVKYILSDYREFSSIIHWPEFLSNKRIHWDSELLTFLTQTEICSFLAWSSVVDNAPSELIIESLAEFREYWNWTQLTSRLEVDIILERINDFTWDLDTLVDKIDGPTLEKLLLKISDLSSINDWELITELVSSEFLESNITAYPFLLDKLSRKQSTSLERILKANPALGWDWTYIATNWSLSFILDSLPSIEKAINFKTLVFRLLNNYSEFKEAFDHKTFLTYIDKYHNADEFRIGRQHTIVFNEIILSTLFDYGWLFWGDSSVAGVEANQSLQWTQSKFERFGNKIKSVAGYDHASDTVDNLNVISSFPDFPWNFNILSTREGVGWTFEFIELHKRSLNPVSLLKVLPIELIIGNHQFFFLWLQEFTENELFPDWKSDVSALINEKFSYQNIVDCAASFGRVGVELDWAEVLFHEDKTELERIAILLDELETELPSLDELHIQISKNAGLNFILDNPELKCWNWQIVTSERINDELLRTEDFQKEYSEFLDWVYLIEKIFDEEELADFTKITVIAYLLSSAPAEMQLKAWESITKKLPTYRLWQLLSLSQSIDVFRWDWDSISAHKHIPITHEFLTKYAEKLNWTVLSQNSTLNTFFAYDKSAYADERSWVDRNLQYLYAYKNEWDFKQLSRVENLTWNPTLINEFKNDWDWTELCANSKLLVTRDKKSNSFEYIQRRLAAYQSHIDWQVLSSRSDVHVSTELIKRFIDKPWSWQKLSSHPNFHFDASFLIANQDLAWDYVALTGHKRLKIDQALLLEIPNKGWDFGVISSKTWVDNNLVLENRERPWDWRVLSQNTNLILDLNIVELFADHPEVDWHHLIQSNQFHVTPDTLKTLDIKGFLDKSIWDVLSGHENLNFSEHPQLLQKYQHNWNWKTLLRLQKFDINEIKTLRTYSQFIDWKELSIHGSFRPTTEVLREFADKLSWSSLSKKLSWTHEILYEFKNFVSWEAVSKSESLNFLTPAFVERVKYHWDYYHLKDNISLSLETRRKVHEIIESVPELQLYFNLREYRNEWSGYIYHFTHVTNAVEIIKSGKILSRNKAKAFADAAGSVVDRRDTAHAYARFYFRPQTPTQFYNEGLGKDSNSGRMGRARDWSGRWHDQWKSNFPQALKLGLPKCPVPVFFRFNLQEVILKMKDKCYMSNGNMQTNWAKVGTVSDMLSFFNFSDVYSTISTTTDRDWKTYINYSQQEFLVKDEFPFSELKDFQIIVANEMVKHDLLGRIEDESIKGNLVVDNSAFNIFHRENKEVYCNREDDVLKLSTDYIGDGINSGEFIIEFDQPTKYEVLDGNVIKATETIIKAFPNVDLRTSDNARYTVYFQDKLRPNKWELFRFN